MKRILRMLIVFVLLVCFSSLLCAYEKSDLIVSLSKVIEYYNDGDKELYNYIDTSNEQMYKDFKSNIGRGKITYNDNVGIIDAGKNQYKLAVLIDANGKIFNSTWSVKNKYMYFTFKYDESRSNYILIDTDFFDASGINILKSAYVDILIKALSRSIPIFIIILSIVSIISKIIDANRSKHNMNYME